MDILLHKNIIRWLYVYGNQDRTRQVHNLDLW